MSEPFTNRASALRERVRDSPGNFVLDATALWLELANINQGIAEILLSTPSNEGGDRG